MRKFSLVSVILFVSINLTAHEKPRININQFLDFSSAVGSLEGTFSFSYVHNWKIGKQKKLEAGLGARLSSYFGNNKEFYTANARLARSTTIPFVIVFAGHEEKNIDTLTVKGPFTTSLNISANFGYNFSSRWYGGINIDIIGYTVGKTTSAKLLSNGITSLDPAAKPANFNLLLTGDNDYGNLNSEFFIKYKISGRWKLKALYQFYFAEYKTQNIHQVAPDGTIVNRFRNKVNAIGIGISYDL